MSVTVNLTTSPQVTVTTQESTTDVTLTEYLIQVSLPGPQGPTTYLGGIDGGAPDTIFPAFSGSIDGGTP